MTAQGNQQSRLQLLRYKHIQEPEPAVFSRISQALKVKPKNSRPMNKQLEPCLSRYKTIESAVGMVQPLKLHHLSQLVFPFYFEQFNFKHQSSSAYSKTIITSQFT